MLEIMTAPEVGLYREEYPLPDRVSLPIQCDMEQLIAEVESYAANMGVTPQKVLRDAIGANWRQWDLWKSGRSSPTMRVVDRLREHMAAPCEKTAQRGVA